VIQSFHKLPGGSELTPRAIVRADSVFETALGLVLVVGAATSGLGSSDFPSPVGKVLVLLFGCALLPVGALLWRLARGPVPGRLLQMLATANAVTAAAVLAWYLAGEGFSSAGSALAIVTVASLAFLAAAQLRAA
jgi:hypothetical protein